MRERSTLLCFFIFLAICTAAQQSIRDARQRSWQQRVYRITSDTAEKYIADYKVSPHHYLNEVPFTVWQADSAKFEELPLGNYIIFSTKEDELQAEFYCQSDLRVMPLNNQYRVQLEVKDRQGNLVTNASVRVNKRYTGYNETIKGFQLRKRIPEDAIIRIAVPGDTLFLEMNPREDFYKNGWQQWWTNFAYTRVGNIITWPVRKVKMMITNPASRWFRKRYRPSPGRNGYVIFSKPKYLPGDTVKYKAYILNRKGRQYKSALTPFLEYSVNGRSVSKNMGPLRPATPGAFLNEFTLGDSLESDRNYALVFKNKKQQVVMRGNFRIEDYLLDEVASYNLRSEKEDYFHTDTLVFYVNAKDANGLALMDGRVNFYLLAEGISKFYKEKEFVPDTLWKEQKPLLVDGDTRFRIPAGNFPDADLSLKAVAEFLNSNNEIQEKELEVEFTSAKRIIMVKQEGAYVIADYLENDRPVAREGLLSYDAEDKQRKVRFPFREKIDPYVENYSFSVEDDAGKEIASKDLEVGNDYSPSFSRSLQKDTAGFTLENPYGIPIHYTVFDGNTIKASATDTAAWITWKTVMPRKRLYNVKWNFIWNGRQQTRDNTIAVLDKLLETKISGAATVYPGQTDTITVSVKDYKGNAASHVNLTAVSYNGQFSKAIRVNEPPYLEKFRTRRRILFDNYEIDDAGFTSRMMLGKNQEWRARFGLDSMKYYQLLFPDSGYAMSSMVINEFLPQVAVHAVRKGVPQEIYLLYINREFAWYNGVTDKSAYAFPAVPGYTQIAFRLRDKFVLVDSIYLQPFYKHDISFDLDHLPAHSHMEDREEFLSPEEKTQLERQIWQLQYDNRTNSGYVWQKNKLVHINSGGPHLIGPFSQTDSLQFFKPGDFDFKFPFEYGYEYKLTPTLARLERKNIFPGNERILLPKKDKTTWILGDTLVSPPLIKYGRHPGPSPQMLKANDYGASPSGRTDLSNLKIVLPPDSTFIYGILYASWPDTTITRIRNYGPGSFNAVVPGRYNLLLITSGLHYLQAYDLLIPASGTYCLQFNNPVYTGSDTFINKLRRQYAEELKKEEEKYLQKEREYWKPPVAIHNLPLPEGKGIIQGIVTDKKGKSHIPGATVAIKGYAVATITRSTDGSYLIQNIRPGNYVLVFSSVGYVSEEIRVYVSDRQVTTVNAQLHMSENALGEVVVVGYGMARKKELTGSISKVSGEELTTVLMGKVSGITVTNDNIYKSDSSVIRIRGGRSVTGATKPVYVINGVIMDELPEDFDMSTAQVSILKDDMASSIYGSRAANGAIVITTPDFLPKTLREKFRDYAFWQPNLLTNENGEAKFTVTYPDNITGWQTYVVGMDRKHRITKASTFTKSFKPLLAQLSAPQFLIEGDSSAFTGKVINYTKNGIDLSTEFRINDRVSQTGNKLVNANGSVSDPLEVVAGGNDTLMAQFTVRSAGGYSDGELRKIPVFRKGTEETAGSFAILDKDTSFSFVPDRNAGSLILHAQNNTLDVLLDEIDYLKRYPYFCMEQVTSKITGLLQEKQMRQALKQPFTGDKQIQRLLERLQKGQLFNGGWSWWEGGDADLSITNYVVRGLLPLQDDALVRSNIRNGLLFLQGKLPQLKDDQLLDVLFTLSEAGHEMDYRQYLAKLEFDSLTVHEQWQVIQIMQKQKMDHEKELGKVMVKRTDEMLGGVHWGTESYHWRNNEMATTALAFKVLESEEKYRPLLKSIIQFFLERRRDHWTNTVESASTLAAILPTLLKNNADFNSTARLQIDGRQVDSFPFTQTMPVVPQQIQIRKSGGGLVYFTAWQKFFNSAPAPVTGKFAIDTWFERTGNRIASLKAGEKVKMKIKVDALKDAEYVQIEIPIPAGCTYAEKNQEGWRTHREFLKNKMVLFIEKMDKGSYTYEIELEPRYPGTYQLNPARAELMYFPVFYGRNGIQKMRIVN